MKPKLYQYAACPFCSKVRTMLEFKGVDYDIVEVHPLNKKEIAFSEAYRKVPIYINSAGKQINDSTPIMQSIDDEFPEPRVFSTGTEGAENEKVWLDWSNVLVKGLPTVIYDSFSDALKSFDYITKVGKFSWFQKRTIKYSGAFIMTLVAKKIRKREQIDNPDEFVREKTRQWVEGLGQQPFMGGESPAAADIAVYGIVRSVEGLRAGSLFRENQSFSAWMDRMKKIISTNSHATAVCV